MSLFPFFLIWFPIHIEIPAIVEKTTLNEVIPVKVEDNPFDSAGTSLEGFLFEQSGIPERYPNFLPECFEDPCVRPEELIDETERVAALHSEILSRLGDEYDSEEFFRFMMTGANPADCSAEYEEYEMFVSCVVGEYEYRKSHKKTLPISTGG